MIGELLEKFGGQRVLVLGDVMLDQYVWGRVDRISPEAPVPVLEAQSEELRLGGAANVALNIRSLGGIPLLVGVTGADNAAAELKRLLEARGISADGLLSDPERSTTRKMRIGAANQQIVRIDYENEDEVGNALREKVLAKVKALLEDCRALIIEDYDKGLLTGELISQVLRLALDQGVPVSVDPKLKHFQAYAGVDIFKPNYKELQAVSGTVFSSDEEFFQAARNLRREMRIRHLIVTRSSLGMYIFSGDDAPRRIPTFAREVFDPSGAGDTVISALTLAWISGADIDLAAELANHAAGVVCGIKGTASVTPAQVLQSYHEQR
ncbi:MAG: D-glycero-beta-D-manno-heptose-7-phosphate kinase [Candidatus Cloacimonetes bacterium]|jgi:D-beta-D-heptose 7-phosphate kinase/D-beta-D-heptose 1-phosphate adenosyltransferase|nr:D-glycero-beta-D-manno-heptose-7-phosphate kinase [Candidatus Cloacimonadota bacterium]MDD3142787.1 D-glycero-beta-D-manno-heptose-7-phosphate kinase [Candidatus Cloacimonadota bacterium]MDY0367498.1 D-glycero-beta-D-manno-heptose-7-phosphate kinase [Candidatus Syntrophosphaera sp.]HOY83845.1 D-glycero-beta-D-manno-heptose-7-phosphate kinase [Candidatus Syntrophosphaera sp.]